LKQSSAADHQCRPCPKLWFCTPPSWATFRLLSRRILHPLFVDQGKKPPA
jgi:hypothetical protein